MRKIALIILVFLIPMASAAADTLRDRIPTMDYGIWRMGNKLNTCAMDIEGIGPIATVEYLWKENRIEIRLFYSLDLTGEKYDLEKVKQQAAAVARALRQRAFSPDVLPAYFVRDGTVTANQAKKWEKSIAGRTEIKMVITLRDPPGCNGVCVLRGKTGLRADSMDWAGPGP